MRTFKKLMSGALAAAIVASMSVSAFAAELNSSNKVVLGSSETYTPAGQTTVLIVPADNWVNDALTGLEDDDILYIDQYESAADATTAITAGLGVKLTDGKLADGDYYVLFGGKTGSSGTFAITAFKMTVGGNKTVLGELDGVDGLTADDYVILAKHLAKMVIITDPQLLLNADIDKSGELTADDAVIFAKYLAKMIDSLE